MPINDPEEGARPAEILLVEDDPEDVRRTREALTIGKLHNNLHTVGDGIEALEFLHRRGKYTNAVRPDVILLDLNLPRKDGREVLAEIKTNDELKRIPVVVITTSKEEEDVVRSYRMHANCYITKPIDVEKFVSVVQAIDNFWLTIVTLLSAE